MVTMPLLLELLIYTSPICVATGIILRLNGESMGFAFTAPVICFVVATALVFWAR